MCNSLNVIVFDTIENNDNVSNHFPIKCEVVVHSTRINVLPKTDFAKKRISWHKVTDNMYSQFQQRIDDKLARHGSVQCLSCSNVKCIDNLHIQELDNLCVHLTNVLVDSAQEVFPKIKPKSKKTIPYWNQEIKPLKQDCVFWHWMWKECNRPSDGIIADIYRHCKR